MRKILGICTTPFQILICLSLKLNNFMNDEVELLISDGITDYNKIVENANKLELFSKVSPIEEKKVNHGVLYKILFRMATLNKLFSRFFIRKFYHNVSFNYDKILFYALSPRQSFVNIVAYAQKKRNNIEWFEEGVLVNSPAMAIFFQDRTSIKNKVFHYDFLQKHITKQYLVNPGALKYRVPFKCEKLHIPVESPVFIGALNTIFDFSLENCISQKYIFFDQNLKEMNLELNKNEILDFIQTKVGKENFIIKLHPRNNTPEFKEKYNTIQKVNIPWEVYLLNQDDIENKVLIGMNTSSLIHGLYYFSKKIKVISLVNFFHSENPFNNYMIKEHFEKNTEIYKCPSNLSDLEQMLGEL